MNLGEALIESVIRAGAIHSAQKQGAGYLFVWEANACEQLEAALQEIGKEHPEIVEKLKALWA